MKLALSLVLATITTTLAAPAQGDDDFIGFYSGIFEDAGSLDHVSITPNPSGGYRIMLHATRFRRCEGADRSAVGFADGTMRGQVMERSNGRAICNGDGSTSNWGAGEFSLSHDDDLLTWTTPSGSQHQYHRISD